MRATAGGNFYAIGKADRGCFRVRCVRFGKLSATYERRADEEIRAITITIASGPLKDAPGVRSAECPS